MSLDLGSRISERGASTSAVFMGSLFRLRVVVDEMQEGQCPRSPRQFLEGEPDNRPCLRSFEIDDARNDTSRVEAPVPTDLEQDG